MGMREWPTLLMISTSSSRSVPTSTATMSTRGTMTSWAVRCRSLRMFDSITRSSSPIDGGVPSTSLFSPICSMISSMVSRRAESPFRGRKIPRRRRQKPARDLFSVSLPAPRIGRLSWENSFMSARSDRRPGWRDLPIRVGDAEVGQDRDFQGLHPAGLGLALVVVTQEVEYAVHHKMG